MSVAVGKENNECCATDADHTTYISFAVSKEANISSSYGRHYVSHSMRTSRHSAICTSNQYQDRAYTPIHSHNTRGPHTVISILRSQSCSACCDGIH